MENKKIIKIYILLIVMITFFVLAENFSDDHSITLLIVYFIVSCFFAKKSTHILSMDLISIFLELLFQVKYTDKTIDKLIRFPIIGFIFIFRYGIFVLIMVAGLKILIENTPLGIALCFLGGILLYSSIKATILLYNAKKEEMVNNEFKSE